MMVPLNVKCRYCKKELMDKENKIDDWPGIKLIIEMDDRKGYIWLSCLYGSYNIKTEIEIPEEKIARFFCPYCNKELISNTKCEQCGAPMVSLELTMGGEVEFCSRKGCKNHFLEFKTIEETMKFYDAYSPYFKPAP